MKQYIRSQYDTMLTLAVGTQEGHVHSKCVGLDVGATHVQHTNLHVCIPHQCRYVVLHATPATSQQRRTVGALPQKSLRVQILKDLQAKALVQHGPFLKKLQLFAEIYLRRLHSPRLRLRSGPF